MKDIRLLLIAGLCITGVLGFAIGYGITSSVLIAAALVVVALIFIGKVNAVQKTAIGYETALSARHHAGQIQLSQIEYSSMEIANLKSDKLGQIMVDAVKSRYENLQSGGTNTLYSRLSEAYPDLSQNLKVYDEILRFLLAERTKYIKHQGQLRLLIGQYEAWRRSGILHRCLVKLAGAPTSALEAHVDGITLTGEEALREMKRFVYANDSVRPHNATRVRPSAR